jgi:DNA polymerase III epsilon subunit-like protein
MDALFVDFETTGRNPLSHQAYEFAAVPVYKGIIRKDLMWHTYLTHRNYRIESDIVSHVAERLANPKPGVASIPANEWANVFTRKLREWFQPPVTLGGKNVGGFDWQFILAMAPGLRLDHDLIRYSHIEIGSMFIEPEDDRIPSLSQCRERAMKDGAAVSVECTHRADDDALLAAELYIWQTTNRILYGRPMGNGGCLKVYHPDSRQAV